MTNMTATPPRRGTDAAVAIPLLAVHITVALGATMVVGLSVMGLDPCAYRECGDPRWADVGVNTAMVSAVGLPVVDLAFIIVQLVRGRPAWPVPLVFCVVHVIVAVVCMSFMVQAGPR